MEKIQIREPGNLLEKPTNMVTKMQKILSTILLVFLFLTHPVVFAHDVACKVSSAKTKNKTYPIHFAVVAITHGELRFIREWVAYHLLIGVEKIYIYDHHNGPELASILSDFIESRKVQLIPWNDDPNGWNETQCKAYMNAVRRAKKDGVMWLGVIDTDEFIVVAQDEPLSEVLKRYKNCGALCINWRMFGTSNVWEIPADKLLIETLRYRSKDNDADNRVVKSIVRPECVKGNTNPHVFILKKGSKQVNTNRKEFEGTTSPRRLFDVLYLNHYWMRDQKFMWKVKIPRRKAWGTSEKAILKREIDFNKIDDPTNPILRHVDPLKQMLKL